MTAFRSREEELLARNHELEQALAAERARAAAAEHGLQVTRTFEAVTDVHVGIARGLLWVIAAGYPVGAALTFPAYIDIASRKSAEIPFEGSPVLSGIFMAIVVSGVFLPVGCAALAGAIGLRRGKRWGYTAAVIAFGCLALCCFPIGLYGLWALLRAPVRNVFHPNTVHGPPSGSAASGVSAGAPSAAPWGHGSVPGQSPPGWRPPGGGGFPG